MKSIHFNAFSLLSSYVISNKYELSCSKTCLIVATYYIFHPNVGRTVHFRSSNSSVVYVILYMVLSKSFSTGFIIGIFGSILMINLGFFLTHLHLKHCCQSSLYHYDTYVVGCIHMNDPLK